MGASAPGAGCPSVKGAQDRPRLVLADDHPDVLDAIRQLLEPEFELLGAVNQGEALIQAATELRPDAVISDIHMPGLDGIETGRRILQKGLCQTIVVLTMYNEPQLVSRALEAGIRGYVLKVDAGEELIPAVYAALSGGAYVSQGVRKAQGVPRPRGGGI